MSVSRFYTVFTATMTSAGTSTSEIDLGGAWTQVYLEIPTLTSNSAHLIQAARATGGTFRRIRHPPINSATIATNEYVIASAATNTWVPIPGGHRFIKVETTATVDDGAIYRVFAAD